MHSRRPVALLAYKWTMSEQAEDRDLEQAEPWLDPESAWALRAAVPSSMPPRAPAT
jgi:hypothetical protein